MIRDGSGFRLLAQMSFLAFALALLVSGCASTKATAPVIERASQAKKATAKSKVASDWRPQAYTVQKGDTLYGIALEHGFDYKEVAEWNGIEPPYTIRIGQQLKLASATQSTVVVTPLKSAMGVETRPSGEEGMLKTQPKAIKQPYAPQGDSDPLRAKARALKDSDSLRAEARERSYAESYAPQGDSDFPRAEAREKSHAIQSEKLPAQAEAAPVKPVPIEENEHPAEKKEDASVDDDERIDWSWPAAGKVIAGFNEASGAGKGLDIGGKSGQPVFAAAPGKVVYSGSGLRGYGKLVIIKHSKIYLSAYAHNNQILVKEGQNVTKGQKIAEMGNSDADQIKLHFEIRRFGKPVDPMKYLPNDRPS